MKPKFAFFALIFNFYFCSSKCSVEENHYISVFSCIDLNVFEYPYLVKERIVDYVYVEPVDYNIYRPFWAMYTENYIWCFTRPGIYYVTLLCPDDTYELVYIHAEQPSVSILVDPEYPVTIGDYFSLNISLSNNGLSEFIYFEFELILVGCDSDENFSNYLYGQRNIITSSNSAIFSSLRIKKSGNFCLKSIIKINVLGWDVDDRQIYKTIIKSSDLIIYSKITDIDLSCDSGLQQYYSNLCNLTVKGDNQTEYLDGFTITLDFDQPVETLEWSSQILIYDSYINFKIYSKNYGLLSATVRLVELTTGNSFTKTIYKDIQNAVLLIDSVSVTFI